MGIVINTNVPSLTAQRNLYKTQSLLNRSLQRLSSGLRINSAKDDAAGLAISDRMTAQIRGLNQAVRNANDGISLAQTAEGALQESTNILQRIRELAIQAANDTNSATDRASLQQEVAQLQQELNRIADTTSFNGKMLFDGTFTAQKFHVGAEADQYITVTIGNARADHIGNNTLEGDANAAATMNAAIASTDKVGNRFSAQNLTISGNLGTVTISSGTLADHSTAKSIAEAVNNVTSQTGVEASARTTATLSGLSNAGTVSFNLYGSNSTAVAISASVASTSDLTDLADEINAHSASTGITATVDGGTITLVSEQGYDIAIENFAVDTTATVDTISFRGASGTTAVTLTEASNDSGTVGGTVSFSSAESYSVTTSNSGTLFTNASNSSSLSSVASIDIGTQSGANSAIDVVDGAIAYIDDLRASLGAVQNRFESTIANLNSVSENISGARSRIMDADFAQETANLTRAQILQQAGLAMLAQANATPQAALTLLQG